MRYKNRSIVVLAVLIAVYFILQRGGGQRTARA